MTSIQAASRVGFLGLGAMGWPMASRISEAGWPIVAVDVAEHQVLRAQAAGMTASQDAAALDGCRQLVIMVATAEQLLASARLSCLTEGIIAVVMSTVGPEAVREFTHVVAQRGVRVVDCPVSGGVPGAINGTLSLFVAGSPAVVNDTQPLLKLMGQPYLCGAEPGMGQAVKIVNQHLATANLAIAAEALGLARAMGLDLPRTLELISSGAGSSWMLRDRGPRMLLPAEERPSLTHLSILAKDANLVNQVARSTGYQAHILTAVSQRWRDALQTGLAQADDSSIFDIMR